MRERTETFAYGESLIIYPFLSADAPDNWMSGSASIEATSYPTDRVHCNVYFTRSDPLTREQWQQLFEAVERGWQWLSDRAESRE